MESTRYQTAKRVFLEACALPASERREFLGRECGADEALRGLVESMLAADGGSHALDKEMRLSALPPPETDAAEPVRRVGRYTVVRLLGVGGMGTVYEAEQQTTRRRVAVKVIRPGLATREGVQRFVHEVRALGRLQHPGIAQIHEAGEAEIECASGRTRTGPFFAMELVEGEELSAYAAARRPTRAEVLELVASVADAVHHAHQKGVVHRDLKPANVIVEVAGNGGGPRLKVLDFGVARLTRQGRTEMESLTMGTTAGELVGTLPYMSPEQVKGKPDDVDARTDIYSLGVVLYELLGGRLPLELAERSLPEAARAIAEEEPAHLGAQDSSLRGDIETIVRKAMEKEPERRYASAAALAEDLRRCVRHEPISARPASTLYHLGKFARRNPPLVAASGLAVLTLIIGLAAAVWQASALARVGEQERLAKVEALGEAAKFRAVTEFLQEMLAAADPGAGPGGPDVTVRRMLDLAAAKLDGGSLGAQPEADLAVRMTLGNSYRALNRFDEAERHLVAAVELGRRVYPKGHADLAWAINKLGRLREDRGRREEGEALHREALAMRKRLFGEEHEDTATSMNNLGYNLYMGGEHAEAGLHLARALEIRRKLHGPESSQLATSLNNLALVRAAEGRLEEAEGLYRRSLELDRRARGGDHPNIAITLLNIGVVTRDQGRMEESIVAMDEADAMMRRVYGPEHTQAAYLAAHRARTLFELGRLDEAEGVLRGATASLDKAVGGSHPWTAYARRALGRVKAAQGAADEGEALIRRALADLPATHPIIAETRHDLAAVLAAQGRRAEALVEIEGAISAATYSESDPRRARMVRLRDECAPGRPGSG